MTNNMKLGRFGNITISYKGKVIDLGRKIVWNRSMNDMTQRELAQRAGISVGYLQKIESNKINPSTAIVDAIAKAFGYKSIDVMLGI